MGASALHYAVSGYHGDCIHLLLQYGANVNAVAISEEVYTWHCKNNYVDKPAIHIIFKIEIFLVLENTFFAD